MAAVYNRYHSSSLNRETLVNTPEFLKDAKTFLTSRGGYNANDLEDNDFLYDKYLEHFRGQATNEVTAARDLYYAKTTSDDELAGMGRLMDTYDKMDGEFGFKAAGDYIEGVLTAPSTYVGMASFGAGKAGGIAAQQALKAGVRSAISKKLKGQTLKQGVKSAAIGTGIDAAAAGQTVYMQEQTRVESGIKEDINYKNVGLGTIIGGTAGGAFGGFSGARKFKTSRDAYFLMNKNLKASRKIKTERYNKLVKPIISPREGEKLTEEGKSAIDIKNYLLGKPKDKLSLEETVPKKLKEGKELTDKLQIKFDRMEMENIAVAAAKIEEILPDLPEEIIKALEKEGRAGKVERLGSRLVRQMQNDKDFLKSIDPILQKHGLTVEHLSSLWIEELSRAGYLLSVIGNIGKGLGKKPERLSKETALALNELDNTLLSQGYSTMSNKARIELEKQNYTRLKQAGVGFMNLNKARIGIMTTQIATTVRNTTNGYYRNYIYALDNINSGAFNVARGKISGKVWDYNNALNVQKATINPKTGKKYTQAESEAILREQGKNIVALGQSQLRTGFQSLLLKDMQFGLMSKETDALFKILGNKEFKFTDELSTLLRGMGDIADIKQVESGILGVAQKLNYFNTLSDNMFKRAVFTRELDKLIRTSPLGANKELDSLAKIIGDGKFHEVPKDYLSRSMTEAWEFTYQTGDFGSRKGWFNTGAKHFVKGFSDMKNASTGGALVKGTAEVARSAVVPFPRYMVNQFRFAYSHMPVLGMINMGGILNKAPLKSQGKTVSRGVVNEAGGFAINADTLGKQLTGLVMLGTFIGLRHNNGDETTGAYEFNIDGNLYDTRAALGPYSAFAFVADLLYRTKWFSDVTPDFIPSGEDRGNTLSGAKDDRLYNNLVTSFRDNPFDWKEAASAITGATSRSGTQLYLVDKIVETVQGRGTDEEILKEVAKVAGNFVNTGLIPLAMLKDIAATTDTPFSYMDDYLLLPNTSADIRPDDQLVSFTEVFLKYAMRSVPKAQNEDSPLALQSSTRTGGVLRYNPIIKQVTGLTPLIKKNTIERELSRLGFEYRDITPKVIRGSTEKSNLSKFYMAEYMENQFNDILESPEYINERTNSGKQKIIRLALGDFKSKARNKAMLGIEVDINDPSHDDEVFLKMQRVYNDFSSTNKRIVEDAYQRYWDDTNRINGEEQVLIDKNENLEHFYNFAIRYLSN